MGKIKKILCMLLVITVVIAPCSLLGNVFAQTGNSVPLTVEVSTDKSSYTAYGIAEITVNVTNTSDETVNNISAEAVFEELAPVGKNNETSKEIESLKSGESFSFSYKATVNASKVKLNFFEKIILWFVRLFNGGYSATGNNFDDNREYISKTNVIDFGNISANNEIKVWYEKNNTTSADYQELISGVDIDEMYDYDESDISVDEESGIEYINNIIIIMFDDDCTDTEKAEAINSINGKVVGGREMTDTLYIKIENKTIDELYEICDELSEKYKLDAFIDSAVYVDSSPISYIPNDPHNFENETETSLFWENYNIKNTAYRNWYHLAIQSVEAWKYNKYFESINIGIVDSGFSTSHEDLNIEIISKNNSVDNHGTHVAGIIGAKANNSIGGTGIVWNKNLYGYSIGTGGIDNRFFRTEIFSGLEALVKKGCKVINFSLGYSGFLKNSNRVFIDKTINMWGEEASKEIAKLLKNDDDFIIIQSAGNGAKDDIGVDTIQNGLFCSITRDNCYFNDNVTIDEIMNRVITVAAATINNGNYQLTDFSNGGTAEISAPGHFIYNTVAGIEDSDNLISNGQKYACLRGTSMAAPIVAGVASLVWSVNPNFSGAEVKEIVCSSYDENILVKDNPSSPTTGDFRFVNAKLAVEEAIKRTYGGVGIVTGIVKDETTGNTISGVNVEVIDNSIGSFDPVATATTDENGQFTINLPYGSYSISFNHDDYENEQIGQLVDCDYVVLLYDILLTPKDSSGDNDEENGDSGNADNGDNTQGGENENNIIASGSCGVDGDNVTYTLYKNGELVISGKGYMKNYSSYTHAPWYNYKDNLVSVVIDERVTSIGSYAFKDCVLLQNIIIPNRCVIEEDNGKFYGGVTSIGNNAFENCTAIEEITIPEGVTNIGERAFFNCTSLENITLYGRDMIKVDDCEFESGITYITEKMFAGCVSLENVTITNGLKTIGNGAFYGCSSLVSITVPESTNAIAGWAFKDCSSLVNATIPYGVLTVSSGVFMNCSSLEEIIIPDSVTSIEYSAFENCTNLLTAVVGNNVLDIGHWVFRGCSKLKNVTIGNCVGYLGSNVFQDCISLENILIPDSVGYIGSSLFSGCLLLKDVTISNNIDSINDDIFRNCKALKKITIPNGVQRIGIGAFENCVSLETITIPESVKTIDEYAFYGCSVLEKVTVTDNITVIGNNAFSNCIALKDIIIPNGVTTINEGVFINTAIEQIIIPDTVTKICDKAFNACSNLKKVIIGSGTTSIGNYAFSNCKKLTDIIMGDNVVSIGNYAFQYCNTLETVVIKDKTTSIGNYVFYNCKELINITIGNSVKNIGEYAFSGCDSLIEVSIPDNVKSLGRSSFWSCDNLKDVIIGNGVISIGNEAFASCRNLENITIGNSVEAIGNEAFYDCRAIKNIILPESIKNLGINVFQECISLTSINIPSSVKIINDCLFLGCSSLESIELSNNITSIGNYAFSGCKALGNISLPENLTIIGNGAFKNCTQLEEVIIPDGITSIENEVFSGCQSISKVEMPNSIVYIGNEAFFDCKNLKSIIIPHSVTSIGDKVFMYCSTLESIFVDKDNQYYSNDNYGVLFNKDKTVLIQYPIGNNRTSYNIPDSVLKISDYAFCRCTYITNVTLGKNVTNIGNQTFASCSNLLSITIPVSVTNIEEYGFYSCNSLINIYYTGTNDQWNTIIINSNGNKSLTNATIHYNS